MFYIIVYFLLMLCSFLYYVNLTCLCSNTTLLFKHSVAAALSSWGEDRAVAHSWGRRGQLLSHRREKAGIEPWGRRGVEEVPLSRSGRQPPAATVALTSGPLHNCQLVRHTQPVLIGKIDY